MDCAKQGGLKMKKTKKIIIVLGILCGLSTFIGGVKLINSKAEGNPFVAYDGEKVYYT